MKVVAKYSVFLAYLIQKDFNAKYAIFEANRKPLEKYYLSIFDSLFSRIILVRMVSERRQGSTEQIYVTNEYLYELYTTTIIHKILKKHIVATLNKVDDVVKAYRKNKGMLKKVFGLNGINDFRLLAISGKPHNNSFVFIVEVAGQKIVVKNPVKHATDLSVNNMLCEINEVFGKEYFYSKRKYLETKNYLYEDFIERTPTASLPEYYERLGYLMAFMYLSNLNDMHAENLIVKDNFPVMIDCEYVFTLNEKTSSTLSNYMKDSVLSSGVLPSMDEYMGKAYDVSVLGGVGDEQNNYYSSAYNIAGKMVKRLRKDDTSTNKANENTDYNEVIQHTKYLTQGFRAFATLVIENKTAFTQLFNKHFFSKPYHARYIRSGGDNYSHILYNSLHPLNLLSVQKRRKFITYNVGKLGEDDANVKQYEIAELTQMSTPSFSSNYKKDLINPKGEILIEDYFGTSSEELMEQKIRDLSMQEAQIQINMIFASIYARFADKLLPNQSFEDAAFEALMYSTEIKQTIAATIAAYRIALPNGYQWVEPQVTSKRIKPKPLSYHIAAGLAGMMLYYISANDKPANQKILTQLLGDFDAEEYYRIGILDGLAGVIYASSFSKSELSAIELAKLNEIKQYVLAAVCKRSKNIDANFLTGLSGVVMAFVAFDKNAEDTEKLVTYFKRNVLLSKNGIGTKMANRTLPCGLGGASGIALACTQLYNSYKDPYFETQADALLAYENEILATQKDSWPKDKNSNNVYANNWCESWLGIGLARLKMKDLSNNLQHNQIALIDKCYENIANSGWGDGIGIRNGNAASLVFIKAYLAFQNKYEAATVAAYEKKLFERKNAQTTFQGIPKEIQMANFGSGLAGSYYALHFNPTKDKNFLIFDF